MSIGENIKKYRKDKKITQIQLASMIYKSESTIQKYESNLVTPNIETLNKIAEALDVPIHKLIGENPYTKMANEDYYKSASNDKIVNLLKSQGLIENKYSELSDSDKKDFLEKLSDISPIELQLQKYLDNFDLFTKKDLVNFHNEINEYLSIKFTKFIDNDYKKLAEDYNKLLKTCKIQNEYIEFLKDQIIKYDELFKKISETSDETKK